jgi:hypothetical protein
MTHNKNKEHAKLLINRQLFEKSSKRNSFFCMLATVRAVCHTPSVANQIPGTVGAKPSWKSIIACLPRLAALGRIATTSHCD